MPLFSYLDTLPKLYHLMAYNGFPPTINNSAGCFANIPLSVHLVCSYGTGMALRERKTQWQCPAGVGYFCPKYVTSVSGKSNVNPEACRCIMTFKNVLASKHCTLWRLWILTQVKSNLISECIILLPESGMGTEHHGCYNSKEINFGNFYVIQYTTNEHTNCHYLV